MRMHLPVTVLLTILWSFAASGSDSELRTDRPTDHVVLVSVDGLRPEFYLDETWPAPMLQQMMREGASALAVRSVFPTVTYPAHTTIITGVPPARHGIYYNGPFDPAGETDRWNWEEASIQVPTLWDAVRDAGLESASVFWPVSVGAPVDRNIPEIWPLDWQGEEFTGPMRRLATPDGLLEELEREATGRLTPFNFSFGQLSLDDKSAEMAAYLLATYKPNLLTLHLIGTDNAQHEEGRDGSTLPRALVAADRALSRLVEAADSAGLLERTTFVITGDHGFIDVHTRLSPNVWLVEAGLRSAAPDRGSWRATVHTTGAAGFVFLSDPYDFETLAEVRRILDSQPPEVRSLFRILEPVQMSDLAGAPGAALGLTPEPGTYISGGVEPPAVRPGSGASHGHLPDLNPEIYTGFVARGAGIRPGAVADVLRLEQIAPLVSSLLELKMPTADAGLPLELLAPPQQPYSGVTPP